MAYWAMCRCINNRAKLKDATIKLVESCFRFLLYRTTEDLSVFSFSLGRFLGSVTGRVYIPVPEDGEYLSILKNRMRICGCVDPSRKCLERLHC